MVCFYLHSEVLKGNQSLGKRWFFNSVYTDSDSRHCSDPFLLTAWYRVEESPQFLFCCFQNVFTQLIIHLTGSLLPP